MELSDKVRARKLIEGIRSGDYMPSTIVETTNGQSVVIEINRIDGKIKEPILSYQEAISTAKAPKYFNKN
ncbi:MAG: hypothetical protein QJ16_C0007G0058 [archaeon GW2011_AR1]|nr:MAG: hypothetical protein QJ16_C0007G0058 [archaeon GW2011_AR1]